MMKTMALALLGAGLSATVALGATAYPYTIAEYEADYVGGRIMYASPDYGWVEPGQLWDMCRIIDYGGGPKAGTYKHVVYVTVEEVASYGFYGVNGIETYAQGSFETYGGNKVDVSFCIVGSDASYETRNLIGDFGTCRLSYEGYEVIYRPTEKSNWFVPVLGVWI